ncbi:aldo/keto reductase [Rhodoluna sp.]|uniref:aldo/keto reductase n=1 Tax=Rhodoluna sp. TaxID=1969481 RepID=UPI0025EA4CF3|nr:aldo/keto reductase [Rhodoluna sp.]
MSDLVTIPKTNLYVYPVCFGGNVFGWTADKAQSFELLDGFSAKGGNFIDTADVYSEWAPGNAGGESESIIGEWMQSKANRSGMIIATKVAKLSTRPGLSRANIIAAAEDSLRRLNTDYIDLYYAHEDDANTPLEETLGAFDELVKAGKVLNIAASNYSGARLIEAVEVSRANGLAEYVALENEYSLMERSAYESDSMPVLKQLGISGLPYFSLAMGFLTGKYEEGKQVESVRAEGVSKYFNEAGWATVANLNEIAAEIGCSMSAVAMAWLRQQPTVSVPIASARTMQQLDELMQVVTLTDQQLARLS